MTFIQVPIGGIFFDTFSGEYFTKLTETTAVFNSGGADYIGQVANFELDEDVEMVEGE
jgi:hypothetical protein